MFSETERCEEVCTCGTPRKVMSQKLLEGDLWGRISFNVINKSTASKSLFMKALHMYDFISLATALCLNIE